MTKRFTTRTHVFGLAATLAMTTATLVVGSTGSAHAPSGAIFTTLPDGSAVNFNIYANKNDVYLDGGPGSGAPQTAAGLDDGTYVFQVTDPSGKTLLSQDPARCRQVTVADGVINGVIINGCEHVTGLDIDHAATTVQLMPYADTPNNGGEYKAWVIEVGDFLDGCAALGQPDGLNVVDCGEQGGNRHGFVASHSKTDNFKVGPEVPVEIDTRFRDQSGTLLDGLKVTWSDTHGASNVKWSEWKPQHFVFHEAHVEAVERGVHTITIADQPGCRVGVVQLDGKALGTTGPQSVQVRIKNTGKDTTVFIDVACH